LRLPSEQTPPPPPQSATLKPSTSSTSIELPRHVPTDRTGSRGVFSGSEQHVFLIGGHRPDGLLTGEIWRYGLESGTWTEIFGSEAPLAASETEEVFHPR